MSSRVHIVICDDESQRRQEWRDGLESLLGTAATVETINDLDVPWRQLLERRASARAQRRSPDEQVPFEDLAENDPETWDGPFDRADVLVVDYDLFGYEPESYLTGTIIAYVARCYSRCKVILGVNQFGRNPFDLTLRSDPSSFNDQSVGEAQIFNLGLWQAGETGGFRPWSWTPLIDLVASFERRVAAARRSLAEGVLVTCGLADVREYVPRSVLGLLERFGREAEVTTLVDLARGARLGYRANDEAASHESITRVAAARVWQWMEHAVLPLQDVLIDVPHLVQRNAAVLGSEPSAETLSRTTRLAANLGELGLIDETIRHAAPAAEWLSRPALLWPAVRADRDLPGAKNPREIPRLDQVFAEDLSRFIPKDSARRFMAAIESTAPARWVANPVSVPEVAQVDYRPLSRLTL